MSSSSTPDPLLGQLCTSCVRRGRGLADRQVTPATCASAMLHAMMRRPLALLVFVLLAASCSAGGGASSSGRVLHVVAAENFWGSVAAQLGGDRARVQSVVTDPNADPHEYESNTNDARAFATADLVVLNGAGYDDWARKLLSASPNAGRKALVVADLLGKKRGDNPHFWYNPAWVLRVTDQITAELKSLDGGDSSYFDEQRSAFGVALRPYEDRLARIKQRFSG